MDWILLIVPGVIWGASFLFIAEGLEAMGPNGVTFTRILVGFLTLALFPGSRRPISRDDWLGTALVGVLWMAFPLSMFPYAEQHVSSALTGMLNGAVPLFTAIVAAGIARRWPSRGIALGLAVGLAGGVLMGAADARPGPEHRARRPADPGRARVLRVRAQRRPPGPAAAGRAAGDLAGAGGGAGADRAARPAGGARRALVARAAYSLLALGALGTGVAYVLTVMAAGRVGATKASATAFLIPPVALLLGVLVRGEHVATLSVLGGVVCLAGAWLMRRAQLEHAARDRGPHRRILLLWRRRRPAPARSASG